MKRRKVLSGALSLMSASPLVQAQALRPAGKIGYLHPGGTTASGSGQILRPAWQRLGYVEGETVLLRFADGDMGRLPQLAAELIALKVGVLIVVGPQALRAASQATKTLAIVAIDLGTDPLRAGLAASFARPGGNVTGLFMDQPALAGKWLELLRAAAPDITRVVLLWDPGTGRDQLEVAQAAAQGKRLETVVIEFGAVTNFDDALRSFGSQQRTGVVVLSSPNFTFRKGQFGSATQKYRLPTIAYLKNDSADVLMTYGPNRDIYFPRAVVMADKILRGEKPGDLPIEGPDHFELVINLKIARALGLTIPNTLRVRADEVIE